MTIHNFKPIDDRILILPREESNVTKSGIILSIKEVSQIGTIIAVGKGNKNESIELAVGDVILYGKKCGIEITIENKDYLLMRQSDILSVI